MGRAISRSSECQLSICLPQSLVQPCRLHAGMGETYKCKDEIRKAPYLCCKN